MKIKNSFLALAALTLCVSPVFADDVCDIPDAECCKLNKLPITKIDYPTNLVDIMTTTKTNIVSIKKELSDRLGDVAVTQMELTDAQKAKGITFVKDGYEENGSVTIGKDAQASISKSKVDSLTSANVLRNVGIAIGTKAVSEGSSDIKNQSIAIGYRAHAKNSNAIAIGPSAQATAENAIQLGTGTNSEANTLKFQDVSIVKNGYLTSGSAIPRELTGPESSHYGDQDFTVDPGSVNTLLPNAELTPGTEISIETKDDLRNFEVFIPNESEVRSGMPMNLESRIADKSVRATFINGVRQAHRLPVKVKVTQPYSRLVLFEVTEIDDGTEWQPVITNCNLLWETSKFVTSGNGRLLEGEYLNSGLTLKLVYPISASATVTNDIRVIEHGDILEGTFFDHTIEDEYEPKSGENLYTDGSGHTWYEIIYTTMCGKEPATFRKEFNALGL